MSSTAKHTPASVLKTFYDEERKYMSAPPEERDFSGVAAILSPDFRLEQTPALPYAGTYIGPAGMQDWMQRMAGYMDIVDVLNPEIFEKEGSDTVVVVSRVRFRTRETKQEMLFPFVQTVRVDVEKGQMTEMRPFYWDVHAVNEALGHVPK